MEDRMATPAAPPAALLHHFADLTDPRSDHTKPHGLLDLVALTLCAVGAGADCWADVESYGHAKRDWLETFLDLPHGIPSHDALGRVFAALDPGAFRRCFLGWMHAVVGASGGRLIAIDGKALRRSLAAAKGKSAIRLVSAWARENHLLLGQQAVADKSNEITAIPALLELLDLQGALVTIDAVGCQRRSAGRIVDGGGDCVLAVKDNRPTLCADVQQLFRDGLEDDFAGLAHRYHRAAERGHGRAGERHYHQVAVPAEVAGRHAGFPGLRTSGVVYSERREGDGELAGEARFYVSSLGLGVKAFAGAVRGHWSVGNNLHWSLDVAFREDESRVRKGRGPENLGLVRRIALSLLRRAEAGKKVGLACKRKQAGWDDEFLLRALLGRPS
jgi:predicted transposase YbfD/YdcC